MKVRGANLLDLRWRQFAFTRKLNMRQGFNGERYFYKPVEDAWMAWRTRSELALQIEGDLIHNAALQQAMEVAYRMAGEEVARAIDALKINIERKLCLPCSD